MLRGEPSWQTSSTGPTSMPSSSEAVATTARQLAGAKTRLDSQPPVHRQAAVVGLDGVLAEAVGELMGDAFGHPPGVDEHEGRLVLCDVGGDALEHRSHLLEGGDGAELVVGKLDGDVEAPLVPDVDDGAARLATFAASAQPPRRRGAGRWSRSGAGSPTARCGPGGWHRSRPQWSRRGGRGARG